MDFRNLNRFFIFNKALSNYNKSSSITWNNRNLSILLAISHNEGIDLVSLRSYLRSFYRTYALDFISATLKEFINKGYIIANGSRPVKYIITFKGQNVLNELELKCRNTRYDK